MAVPRATPDRDDSDKVRLTVRMTVAERRALEAIAQEKGFVGVTGLIYDLVRREIAARGKKQPG